MTSGTTSETRLEIADLVEREPGATPSDLARDLAIDHSTASYHLRRLARDGLVHPTVVGRALRYYATGCGICPFLRNVLPMLRDPRYTRIIAELERRGGCARAADLAQAGEGEGCVRGKLNRLRAARIVQRTPAGWELTQGTALCRERATADARCDLWGECYVSHGWPGAGNAAS